MISRNSERKVFVVALESSSIYYLPEARIIVSRLDAQPERRADEPKDVALEAVRVLKRHKK